MGKKCEEIFREIMWLVPEADFKAIRERRNGKLRFEIFINDKLRSTSIEALDLSPRSINCLHRAGFETIADVVEQREGVEDLRKIRNCGTKSVNEIMEQLFCYQYMQLRPEKKLAYIAKLIKLNLD